MSKRQQRSITTLKSVPAATSTEDVAPSQLPINPSSRSEQGLENISLAVDPVLQFKSIQGFFKRREFVYSMALSCSGTNGLVHTTASDLAAQQIHIVPTETNPSASTLLIAEEAAQTLNTLQGKPGGLYDFYVQFLRGVWFSKTGAFIAMPVRNGEIESIGIIPPTLPYPYFGWETATNNVSGNPQIPLLPSPSRLDEWGNPLEEIKGIFYTDLGVDQGRFYTLPVGSYFQVCPGAASYGAFQTTIPLGEQHLGKIASLIALEDYIRNTINNTDDAQAVVWNNVDARLLKAINEARKKVREMRRSGKILDEESMASARIHVTPQNMDKPASVDVANLRVLPEDFDPLKWEAQLSETLALMFGVHPRRITPSYGSERFGNATQAAMLNHDEPGVRMIESQMEQFITHRLLEGLNVKAQMVAETLPKNYAVASRDNVVSQTLAQIAQNLDPREFRAYAQRMGLLRPSEVQEDPKTLQARLLDAPPPDPNNPNQPFGKNNSKSPADQNEDDDKQKSVTFWPRGFASVRHRDGTPFVYNKPIIINKKKATRADTLDDMLAEIEAIYESWMMNDLPLVIREGRISRQLLIRATDDMASQIWAIISTAFSRETENDEEWHITQLYQAMRAGFFNAFASPELRPGLMDVAPSRNLFNVTWSLAGAVSLGRADAMTLQREAAKFKHYFARYFNSIRSARLMREGLRMPDTVPVTWVRNVAESCGDCTRYEGTYPNFKAMLRATRNMTPGDPRLQCSGNCKCNLSYGSAIITNTPQSDEAVTG